MLSVAPRRRKSGIKSIILSGDDHNYETVMHIIDLCNSCPQLQALDLSFCKFGNQWCREIASLLENRHSKLKDLKLHDHLFDHSINDEGVLYFINALSNHNVLWCMEINGRSMTDKIWDPLSAILFNTSSINATIRSNHKLWHLLEIEFDDQDRVSRMLTDDVRYSYL